MPSDTQDSEQVLDFSKINQADQIPQPVAIYSTSPLILLSSFQNGSASFCPPTLYTRFKPLSEDQKEETKNSLLFWRDGEVVVEILNPIVFFTKPGDSTRYCLDGNNKLRALFELIQEYPEYQYKDVRYRLIENLDSVLDILNYQDSINTAASHSVLDRAKTVLLARGELHKQFLNSGLTKKQVGAKITEEISRRFRVTPASITNAELLLSLPGFVLNKVLDGKLSPDTAIKIHRELVKVNHPSFKEVEDVWQAFFLFSDQTGSGYYLSVVDSFLSNLPPVVSSAPLEATTTESEENDNSDNNQNAVDSGEEDGIDGEQKVRTVGLPITREKFEKDIEDIFYIFSNIDKADLAKNKQLAANTVKTGLQSVIQLHNLLSVDDSIVVFDLVRQLLLELFGNPGYLADRSLVAEIPLNQIEASLKGFSRNAVKLYSDLYEPKKTKKGKDNQESALEVSQIETPQESNGSETVNKVEMITIGDSDLSGLL